jgi:hypothetical protein
MSVCLDYQAVKYKVKKPLAVSFRMQFCAALFLLSVLVLKVWVRIENTNYGYILAKEKQVTVDLDMQRRELELQLSVLERTDNLTHRARKQLGLVSLNPAQAKKIYY